jgi:hypothetical protein
LLDIARAAKLVLKFSEGMDKAASCNLKSTLHHNRFTWSFPG